MKPPTMTQNHQATLSDAIQRFEESPAFTHHPPWQAKANRLREIRANVESQVRGDSILVEREKIDRLIFLNQRCDLDDRCEAEDILERLLPSSSPTTGKSE